MRGTFHSPKVGAAQLARIHQDDYSRRDSAVLFVSSRHGVSRAANTARSVAFPAGTRGVFYSVKGLRVHARSVFRMPESSNPIRP
jgi:hypothetical protein